MPPLSSHELHFCKDDNAMAQVLAGVDTITLPYDVPERRELAAIFAKNAKISANGKTVEVGSFTAKRLSLISRFLFATTPGAGCNWLIRSSSPTIKNAVGLSRADRNKPDEIIALLANAEAGFHISEDEKHTAIKNALEKKVTQLHR